MKHRRKKERTIKMNSLNLSHYIRRHSALLTHAPRTQKRHRKCDGMHRHHAQNIHFILRMDLFNQQFSDRWLGALLYASPPLLFLLLASLWVLIWCAMFATIRLKASRSSHRAHSVRSSITHTTINECGKIRFRGSASARSHLVCGCTLGVWVISHI